jgi:hypothetical protein
MWNPRRSIIWRGGESRDIDNKIEKYDELAIESTIGKHNAESGGISISLDRGQLVRHQ